MIYTELEVRSARSDLHSGMYGGAAPNSFVSLAQILAKLKDENGHILIPGFYDDIIPPSKEELAAWKSLPFDEEEYRMKEVGSKQLVGEKGYSVLERTWARPTVDVHGIPGGFTGAGAKTVIPAKATAKVSMRLVPGMTPAKAFALYKSYVEKIAPDGVDVEVRLIHSGDPCLIPGEQPVHPGGHARAARGVGQGHGVYPLRRIDPYRGRLRPSSGAAQRDDGLRPARRQPACAQREVSPEELLAGDRIADSFPGGGGKLSELSQPMRGAGCRGLCSRRRTVEPHGRGQGAGRVSRAAAGGACAGYPASGPGCEPRSPASRAALGAFAPVVEDAEPGLGPLGGICAALGPPRRAGRSLCPSICLCCLRRWFGFCSTHARITGSAVTLASVDGFVQTFPAVLERTVLPALQAELEAGRARVLLRISGCRRRPGRQTMDVVAAELLAQGGQVAHPHGLPAAAGF